MHRFESKLSNKGERAWVGVCQLVRVCGWAGVCQVCVGDEWGDAPNAFIMASMSFTQILPSVLRSA